MTMGSIKVYVTSVPGSVKLRKQQQQVVDILEGLRIPFDRIDISDPARDKDRKFVRANAKGRKAGATPLPPQIFNQEDYCGGFDKFDFSVETNQLYEFLKLDNPNKPTVTDAQEEDEEKEKGDEMQFLTGVTGPQFGFRFLTWMKGGHCHCLWPEDVFIPAPFHSTPSPSHLVGCGNYGFPRFLLPGHSTHSTWFKTWYLVQDLDSSVDFTSRPSHWLKTWIHLLSLVYIKALSLVKDLDSFVDFTSRPSHWLKTWIHLLTLHQGPLTG